MAQKLFAVAVHAYRSDAPERRLLRADLVPAKSAEDAFMQGLLWAHHECPPDAGWVGHEAITLRVPRRVRERMHDEAAWYDQTGARRLYAVARYVRHPDDVHAHLSVAYIARFSAADATDQAMALFLKECPVQDGWSGHTVFVAEWFQEWRPSAFPRYVPEHQTTH